MIELRRMLKMALRPSKTVEKPQIGSTGVNTWKRIIRPFWHILRRFGNGDRVLRAGQQMRKKWWQAMTVENGAQKIQNA